MTTFLTPPSPITFYQMVNLSLVSDIRATREAEIIFCFLDGKKEVIWKYESREETRAAFDEIMNKISINPRGS